MIKDDYAEVNVPMLPVVEGEEETARQIWLYTLVVVPFSFLLVSPLGSMGLVYTPIALVLGMFLLLKARQVKNNPFDKDLARSLFKYSILYMMLLCTGIVIDSLPFTQRLLACLS
jgi:protoheme IX farnesyltransferase